MSQPSPRMAFERTFACSLFVTFVDLRRWMRSPRRSSAPEWPSARSWSWIFKRTIHWTPSCAQQELTNKDLIKLEAQRKDEERQEEEVTEEPKRFMTQEMARRFSLFEEALLVFEAQKPNPGRYMKAGATIQNAIQCYHDIYDEKKSYYPSFTGSFFQKGRQN